MIDISAARDTPGFKSDAELEWLARTALGCQRIVEIGTWRGKSTRALADHCPGTVYTIDTFAGDPRDPPVRHDVVYAAQEYVAHGSDTVYGWFCERHADLLAAGKIVSLRMPATAGLQCLDAEFGRTFDLAFIDGCHNFDAVKEDIAGCRRLVRPGGIISGHDYWPRKFPGVPKAVHEAFGDNITVVGTIWWVLAR